jgi:hypothetical protein
MRGRKIDRIIIDEATEISEEDLKKFRKMMRGSFGRRILSFIKKVIGIKETKYWMGIDYSSVGSTSCTAHKNKKGEIVIDKILEEQK